MINLEKIQALKDEFIYSKTLESGLKVAVHPKQEFHNIYVTLQVNFGGTCIKYKTKDSITEIPAGVAHFLEHIMFHNSGFDLPERFAISGAEINAYTSKSITAYQFKTINHIHELLSAFMDNFIKFDVSDEVIEKERQIIIHEIKMSKDSIHFNLYKDLMKMMYTDYCIYSDVGGETQDVLKITHDILEKSFNTFYNPENMTLVVTGNVVYEEIFELLENHQFNKKQWPKFNKIKPIINYDKLKEHHIVKTKNDVEEPMINFTVRIPRTLILQKDREFLHIALGSIIANVLGLGSKTFDYLEKNNLMNISFYTKLTIEKSYGYLSVFIQTNKVLRYKKTMLDILLKIAKEPLDKELFEVNKRNVLGNYITLFDNLSRVHNLLCNTIIEGVNIDQYLQHIINLRLEDLEPYKAIFTNDNIYSITYLKAKKN